MSSTTSFNIVGEGPPNAKIVLVGEAPGAVESTRLRVFVGQAGQLLREGLLGPAVCSKVFFTNILACRPPRNRNPFSNEEEVCVVRLQELFTILQPKLVVAVGRVAEACLAPFSFLSYCFVYHPAFLLRNGVTLETLERVKLGPVDRSSKIECALIQYKRLRKTILNM